MPLGHGDFVVGQSRPADDSQSIVFHHETAFNPQCVANAYESPALTLLGTLTVTDVKRGGLVISCSQGRANRGIHASAKQHNRTRFL
jgi:hypothetical protein